MVGRRVPAAARSGPGLDYPDRCLPDLVAEWARAHPDAVAVRQREQVLTYRELVTGAAGVAARLTDLRAGPETVVAVCARRRPYLVTGLLGVLCSGAAYLPLDPGLPSARLTSLIADAGVTLLVADAEGAELLAGAGCTVVELPGQPSTVDYLQCPANLDNAAYVIYTSGSTGVPKGVVVAHRALTQFVAGTAATAELVPTDVSSGFASVGFDLSVMDIIVPLAVGVQVALTDDADRTDPARLQSFFEEHRVTFADVPPAVLPMLDPDRLPRLRVLVTGSEAPGPEQVARWSTAHRRFLNCYGPTETTVQVTAFDATGEWDQPLPIGTPLPNQRVYVVDADLREVGIGVPGELLIGGPGLARGYLGAPALTAERFIPDPFSGQAGARLYRTGDLVVWQPDATLMFLGRTDRQVKIRGQRVEIGEVETVLRGHPAVRHAVVDVATGAGGAELVAYVTMGADEPVGALREHCALRLTPAMVPAVIHIVDQLPLGSTGKVDLRRLRELAGPLTVPRSGPAYVAPVTEEEKAVADAWAEVLGGDQVGRDDDFFDAGGHSITAMRLVAALRARLARDVAIEDVLGGRTVATIAARVAAAPALDLAPAVRGRPPALSPAQRRLWFLDRYAPEAAAAYNIGVAERLRGPLDIGALRAALRAVATRQEVLRWRIPDDAGVPYAVLDPRGDVPLPVEEVSEAELAGRLAAHARERFDLATERLWRVRLFRLGEDDHVLALTAHHAVFDGWSQALFYEDLAAAYRSARAGGRVDLPPLPATYADYVAWREQRQDPRADADLRWWLDHLDGVPTVLELPGDRPRPAEQTFRGAYARTELDAVTTAELGAVARTLGATPSAMLLAALAVLVARSTGLRDMVVGSPTVDRRHVDFEEMVGFFIEIAPLRLRVDEEASFGDHVRLARDELMAALAHPEAPLDRIVDAFGLGGELSRSPLVQVLFNMFNFAAQELELPGVLAEPVPVDVPGSPFDLTVYGVERAGRLTVELVYNPDLYDAVRMQAWLDALRQVLVQGVAAPGAPVGELALPAGVPLANGPAPEVPRARLRVANAVPAAAVVHPPESATEEVVAAIWCEVLGLPAVGVTETFFDAGGGSLAIVAVQHRLNEKLGRQLRVVDLFRYPTVRALAAHLDGDTGSTGDNALDRAARRGAARRDRARRRPAS
jgi:mycobactin peptide synthetase MbtE